MTHLPENPSVSAPKGVRHSGQAYASARKKHWRRTGVQCPLARHDPANRGPLEALKLAAFGQPQQLTEDALDWQERVQRHNDDFQERTSRYGW